MKYANFKEFFVSIHAPTRGATRIADLEKRLREEVSIHAPTRGATLC